MFQIGNSFASIRDEIVDWPGVTAHPHDGGTEFRYRGAQIGHIHEGGAVHIRFARPIHDQLLAQGLASEHRWSPNSGWTSFQVESDEDAKHALWLMRLSYLRYALKGAANAREMLDRASHEMSLTPDIRMHLSSAAGPGTELRRSG